MMNHICESFAMLWQAKECNIFKSDSPLRGKYTQPVFRSKNNSIGNILNRMTYSGCFSCSAPPAGNYFNGTVNNSSNNANFWSATPNNANNAYNYNFNANNRNVNRNINNKNYGFSVRCVREIKQSSLLCGLFYESFR